MARFSFPRPKKLQTDAQQRPVSRPDAPVQPESPSIPERRARARLSFGGFRDPVRRPRHLVWTGVGVLLLAAVVVMALGVTSTRWFCSEGCHKVQDDTIMAYRRSTHSNVSCMACHMPVGADPFTFLLHKAEALGELYLTVTDDFSLPLNPESRLALEMPEAQCLQCHNLETRRPTPTPGVVIDHDVHSEKGIGCGACHNRVGHNEEFQLTLKDPGTGEPNRRHEVFTSMTACFRCHEQTANALAPGRCSACHAPGYELKPPSHREPGFYPEGHARLAKTEESRTAVASANSGRGMGEGSSRTYPDGHEAAEPAPESGDGEAIDLLALPKVASINVCTTCHVERFCIDCHGVPMPHPAEFKKEHGSAGKKDSKACELCHGSAEIFCDECHHGTAMRIPYESSQGPWKQVHPAVVRALGANACFGCHNPTHCAVCHVRGITD